MQSKKTISCNAVNECVDPFCFNIRAHDLPRRSYQQIYREQKILNLICTLSSRRSMLRPPPVKMTLNRRFGYWSPSLVGSHCSLIRAQRNACFTLLRDISYACLLPHSLSNFWKGEYVFEMNGLIAYSYHPKCNELNALKLKNKNPR